ncbi:uncharacterized protein TRIVIDRAFT_215664 [Trichoderma virens Gv29-8]|uniref:Secreted protein n=1 Tax=Hypocrea virens (strain Gv29-8 / FGSC 10586) TaxID=413071 RepID=G9MKK8_HYPVG|nr:uncharacterized protein TRIVIDRAFT_215664 [Trichoderma virens Gv29-8]EHK24756.1 hypothetical protein TRIVIDRAFT_215664 [Trichoderma virens Gv29-8]
MAGLVVARPITTLLLCTPARCARPTRAIERQACLSQSTRLRRGRDRLHHTFFSSAATQPQCNAFWDPLGPLC